MIEIITGASAGFLDLRLLDSSNVEICRMDDNDRTLGSYPVENNMRIHAIDTNPHAAAGEFEDVSKVEKFEISHEEYSKRADTVRAFKLRNQIGRFNPENIAKAEEQAAQKEVEGQEKAATIKVGDRCQVAIVGAGGPRRGTVRYVGKTQFSTGYWVGVQYDEPVGKHDGSVDSVRYFSCPDKYGAFVRPATVEVGDFPEEDLGLDDEM